jgi:hypothetical protein
MADRVFGRGDIKEEMLFVNMFNIVASRPYPLRLQRDVNFERHDRAPIGVVKIKVVN